MTLPSLLVFSQDQARSQFSGNMSKYPEDKEKMKMLESWLDKTSTFLLSEADDIMEDKVNIIERKQEEYKDLGFRKESIQTQMNR